MKIVTTNRLNRFWKNGVLPIKEAIVKKLDIAKVINNLLTTEAGYSLDARQGKVLDDKITELNSKIDSAFSGGNHIFVFIMSSAPATSSGKYNTNSIYLPESISVKFISATYYNGSSSVSVSGTGFEMYRNSSSLGFYCSSSVLAGKAITVTVELEAITT